VAAGTTNRVSDAGAGDAAKGRVKVVWKFPQAHAEPKKRATIERLSRRITGQRPAVRRFPFMRPIALTAEASIAGLDRWPLASEVSDVMMRHARRSFVLGLARGGCWG
jgi:hypothetical protein